MCRALCFCSSLPDVTTLGLCTMYGKGLYGLSFKDEETEASYIMLKDLLKVTRLEIWRQQAFFQIQGCLIHCLPEAPLWGIDVSSRWQFVVETGCLLIELHCLPSYFHPLPLLLASEECLTNHQKTCLMPVTFLPGYRLADLVQTLYLVRCCPLWILWEELLIFQNDTEFCVDLFSFISFEEFTDLMKGEVLK